MKIAVCFIGLPRFIEENSSIRKNLISQNENVDIFVHTWGAPHGNSWGEGTKKEKRDNIVD